jgi:hypothetical protein
MKHLWLYVRDSEPVVLFTALATLVPLATNGLVVFGVWGPNPEQLAYVNGFVVVVSAAFGVRSARNAVQPIGVNR